MASDDEIVGLAEAILGAAAQDLEDEGLDILQIRWWRAAKIKELRAGSAMDADALKGWVAERAQAFRVGQRGGPIMRRRR